MSEEEFLWSGSPSQMTNILTNILFGLIAFTVVAAPISAVVILWRYLVTKCQRYELTSQRLKCHSGVLSKRTDEVELYRVKDTRYDQPFFLRLVNLGNVVLITSDATTPTITIHAVKNASELREKIRNLVEKRRDVKRARVIEADADVSFE